MCQERSAFEQVSSAPSVDCERGLKQAASSLLAGELDEARETCCSILGTDPGAQEILHLLGLMLARSGNLTEAVANLEDAIRSRPDEAQWHCDLGIVYAAQGKWRNAICAHQKAYELIPSDTQNLASYAAALLTAKEYEQCTRIALLLLGGESYRSSALQILRSALWCIGDVPRVLRVLEDLSDAGLSDPETESFRLSALLHASSQSREAIVEAHRRVAEKCYSDPRSNERETYANSRDPERSLRVGYLTGELSCCPGFHFLEPILRGHDAKSTEVFCYHTRENVDSCGRAIQALGHRWHDVYKLTDEALRRLIRSHEIDVLIDFSGHFDGHRLQALASRLAPVQVFYPNYPATSGLASVDYVLTDQWLCPPGLETNYSETVYRVPSGCLVYNPPGRVATKELPAQLNGFVTFGLFQRASKLNPICWDAISGVMKAVPRSHLLIQYDAALIKNFKEELTSRGVSGERVGLKDRVPLRERVQLLADVDIALDTFPYNGQTTTCECLWMGVPVVTRSGETHVSRVAGSILQQVGLSDWIANSNEEYIAIAARKANDLRALGALRAGLRERMAGSTLMDARGKAREMEQAYREMWRAWVQSASSPTVPTRNAG